MFIGLDQVPEGTVAVAVNVLACYKAAPGRRTHRVLNMALLKGDTFPGKAVEIRRFNSPVSVDTQGFRP